MLIHGFLQRCTSWVSPAILSYEKEYFPQMATAAQFSQYMLTEFAAQEQAITIVPKFSMDEIEGIGGTFGPFAPNYPTRVPLWLALYLRETNTCTITPPDTLQRGFLEAALRAEISKDAFFPLPLYFFETVALLTKYAVADIPDVVEVERLAQEIQATRVAKIRKNLGLFRTLGLGVPGVQLTGLIFSEIHSLRASMIHVLNDSQDLDSRSKAAAIVAPTVPLSTVSLTPAGVSEEGTALRRDSGGARVTSTVGGESTAAIAQVQVPSDALTVGLQSQETEGTTEPQYKRRRTLRPR